MTFFVFMDYGKNLDLEDIKYFYELDQVWKVEEWLYVPNYNDRYQASDLGRVKSLNYNHTGVVKILSQSLSNKYRAVSFNKFGKENKCKVHQLVAIVFYRHIPCGMKKVINHKNFIKTDNRKVNIEITTNRENTNRKHLKSTSKYVGVSSMKNNSKWRSQIVVNGKVKHLGMFFTEEEASNAYQIALKNIKK